MTLLQDSNDSDCVRLESFATDMKDARRLLCLAHRIQLNSYFFLLTLARFVLHFRYTFVCLWKSFSGFKLQIKKRLGTLVLAPKNDYV